MAIAALVLGIIAVVFAFIPGLNFLSPIIGIVGIILAVVSRKQENTPVATAGLVLSIIGLVLGLFMWVACTLCTVGLNKALDKSGVDIQKKLEEATKQFEDSGGDIQKKLDEAKKQLDDATKQVDKAVEKGKDQI